MVTWRVLQQRTGKKSSFLEMPDFHSFFSEFPATSAQILLEITKNFLGSAGKNQGRLGDRNKGFFRPYNKCF